jgi:hypothetical protein
LGGLWALCGLGLVGVLIRYDHWSETESWIAVLLGAAGLPTGIGFILGRTWAQIVMAVLMAITALFLLWMTVMAGFNGNRQFMYLMMVAVGIAGYTLFLAIISAASHPDDPV